MESDTFLVVCRGAPALVGGLLLEGRGALRDEPLAPAAHAARPTAADVDLAARALYYCDVHRYRHTHTHTYTELTNTLVRVNAH